MYTYNGFTIYKHSEHTAHFNTGGNQNNPILTPVMYVGTTTGLEEIIFLPLGKKDQPGLLDSFVTVHIHSVLSRSGECSW
ncbi:unnamed protein product [Leptidea sinapis]|uniref:Uncharacterized protein n=1 Tax=Leptidea sinapis TaxID=189913 RepID=A0A5E4PPG2_9NEOP|nr:unnamed protein product [Leptidea sinapis]